MTDLRRQPVNLRRGRDVRRLLIALALFAVASPTWHAVRDYVLREFAESSLGCDPRAPMIAPRAPMIAEAVWRRYPDLRTEPVFYGAVSYRSASSTGALCEVRASGDRLANGISWGHVVRYAVVNARLDLAGFVTTRFPPLEPVPGDRDSEGSVEVVNGFYPDMTNIWRPASGWAIARLGESANEIAGLVLLDETRRGGLMAGFLPEWRDEDGDGQQELIFLAWTWAPSAGGRSGYLPPETVAVFEWDRPGGILRPKVFPDDGSVLVWTPADGKPYAFSPDEPVEDVARKLLPIPDGFGVPATAPAGTQPATSPAGTQPATSPAPP